MEPLHELTAASIVRQAARRVPEQVAVVGDDGREVTYRELVSTGGRLASALLDLGLEPGDRVAAWMEDVPEYVTLYVACAFAGLVVVPINARLTPFEAAYMLDDSQARILVCTAGITARVRELAATGPDLTIVVVAPPDEAAAVVDNALSFEFLVTCGREAPLPARHPDELFMIGYTSGTTGRPKGAMLTQGSVATLAHMNARSYRLVPGSIAALTGSMSFVAVVPSHIFSHFTVCGTVRFLGKWDVDSLLDTIEKHSITFTYLPSPVLTDFAIAASARPEAWTSLVSVLHSGSKAPVAKLRQVADVIGGVLFEGWGMTENSGGLLTATTPGDAASAAGSRDRLGSIGRPVADVRIRVLDPTGNDVPADGETVGELVVHSPALFVGYWRNPDATAGVLAGGWYHTGDLGSIDEAGYIWMSERRSDLIVSGGMNVYPSEVEETIMAVPGVQACAVVGLPHERWGQSVAAAIVLAPGAYVAEDDILDACRIHLAGYKKPTRIVFVDALPMTTSMKVSRHRLREDLLAGT